MATRNTIQKQLVIDAVRALNNHPTVAEIYACIVEKYPGISKATVYRNVGLLVENGVLVRLAASGEADRFDCILDAHYHFRCKVCGTIADMPMPYQPQLDETAANAYGYNVDSHDIVFSGLCPACRTVSNCRQGK
ncbi:MAG: transcriptional repressor [Acholeplasmataceae bacterium]|jgi:Fe2+ or Zn2+ uptake regulation protein|nr:transcriptional repressor [Acidaminococcaceae bacterium]NLY84430.1 transcriptional repressor [Acholeplasmataceae bacterium]